MRFFNEYGSTLIVAQETVPWEGVHIDMPCLPSMQTGDSYEMLIHTQLSSGKGEQMFFRVSI
jgi:hypothetical protein